MLGVKRQPKFLNIVTLKLLFTALVFVISYTLSAQKFALVDRVLKKPILYTDSVTISQINKNYFPVAVKDLDSLFANITFVTGQLKSIQRAKFKSYKLRSGNTIIQIVTVSHAYGDAFDISLVTNTGYLIAEYLISPDEVLNKKAVKRLNAFMKFIKKDKELMINELRDYEPVILDPTIYISPN